MSVIASYEAFVMGVKTGLLLLGIIVALICTFDWAVRTRKINPFARSARFFRGRIEPLMHPVERMVLRTGASPSSTPWWALLAFALCGIIFLSLLGIVHDVLFQVVSVIQQPSDSWRVLLGWTFSILRLALIVRVLSSWLPISPYSKWIRWSFILTEWIISPLRRVVPTIGVIDITPIVAWFLLTLLQSALGSL